MATTEHEAPAPGFALAHDRDGLVQFRTLADPEPGQLSVLYLTNQWPDERRPYFGPYTAAQARSLTRRGLGVDVLYLRGFVDTGLYARALLRLPAMRFARRYDVIHAHYGHTLAAALGMRQAPLVISFCGEDLLGAPRGSMSTVTRKSAIERAVFRQLARMPAGTITKSLEMERTLPRSVQSRNTVLPNGVDLGRFAPQPRAQARAALGWDQDAPTVLFLGDAGDPRKNVALAREAIDVLRSGRPEVVLREIGGVSPELVPTLLSAADCLAFPSLSEGSPNVIKESMACALPIVAGNVGDIAERLDGCPGGVVCPHRADAFAHALAEMLERFGDGRRAPALRTAVTPLGIDATAGKLIDVYRRAIARRPRRPTGRRS